MVQCQLGSPGTMCVVAAIAQHLFCGGHHRRSATVPDPVIVSDLVYLDDAPKGEDSRPGEDGTLEMIRRAV